MNVSRLGVVLVILGALLLGTGIASADQDVNVELTEFKFVPTALSVKAGEKVRFMLNNTGRFPHDLHIEGQGVTAEAVPAAGNLATGQKLTWEFTFDKAGAYTIWCPVGNHRAQGMEGTLTVTTVAAAASGAAAPSATTTLPKTGEPEVFGALTLAAGALFLGAGWTVRRRAVAR